ncbi:MAG: hypothetical protein ACP8RL_02405, partial [cyanobacterium endosymbiont of Rhopalodia inflata]
LNAQQTYKADIVEQREQIFILKQQLIQLSQSNLDKTIQQEVIMLSSVIDFLFKKVFGLSALMVGF